MKTQLIPIAVIVLLTGCHSVGPDYEQPTNVVDEGSEYRGARNAPRNLKTMDRWWRALESRELNGLIDQALNNNYDLAIAQQRLREARAMRKHAASAILPKVRASALYSRDSGFGFGGLSGIAAGATLTSDPLEYWNAGLDASWEIDIFGGKRREIRGAQAREAAAREALHGVRLALAAEVAETYFTIATLREQQATLNAQISLLESQNDEIRERVEAGSAARLELDRALARLEKTRVDAPQLTAGIATQQNRLALLLGARSVSSTGARALPTKLPMAQTGIPADLLLRRPDLRQAERELAAATEDIGVAVANFYPKFSIGGGPSGFTDSLSNLFKTSNYFWRYTPQLEWSIFDGGANRATLEAANARQRTAFFRYQKSVLSAIAEVETELANLSAESQQLKTIQRAIAATESATKRVRANYKAGAVAYLDVLTEEQQLREIELSEIRVKSQMLQVWIRLHKALGGGWK